MLNKNINTKDIANFPGVYKMLDDQDTIIYIGKAKSLFNRIKSYTQKNLDIKTEKMTSLVKKIETIVTKTEFEAILLELFLIKKHKPKYNIIEKDDKSSCYIEIDRKGDFPAIKINRTTDHRNFLLGPFLKKNQAKKISEIIKQIFKIRDCSDAFFKSRKKPCIEYDIKKCSAPCVNFISIEEYKLTIKKIEEMFKEQKTSKIEKEIKKQINIFIEREEYEKAKEENEKLKIFSNMKNFKDFKDFDLIYIEEDNNYVFINISVFRYGIKIESIFDVIKKNKNDKGYEKIVDFFENLYKRIEIPQSLIVNKSIDFFSFPQNQQI